MPKRLFISKNLSEIPALAEAAQELNLEIHAKSFLDFAPMDFEIKHSYDIVFFGSPRAIFFFKRLQEIPESVLIACAGSKTKEIVESIGREVAFCGEGGIAKTAQDFKSWCGERRVLFPTSNISLHTISSQLNSDQVEVLQAYSTSLQPRKIDPMDFYVFTSPSNADAFLKVNTAPVNSTIIAWGESTESFLKEHNATAHHTLEESSIDALIELLKQH